MGMKAALDYWRYGSLEGMERRLEEMRSETEALKRTRDEILRSDGAFKFQGEGVNGNWFGGILSGVASMIPFVSNSNSGSELTWRRPRRETPEEEEERIKKIRTEYAVEMRKLILYPENPIDRFESTVYDGIEDMRLVEYLRNEDLQTFMPDMFAPYPPNHNADPEAVQAFLDAAQERVAEHERSFAEGDVDEEDDDIQQQELLEMDLVLPGRNGLLSTPAQVPDFLGADSKLEKRRPEKRFAYDDDDDFEGRM